MTTWLPMTTGSSTLARNRSPGTVLVESMLSIILTMIVVPAGTTTFDPASAAIGAQGGAIPSVAKTVTIPIVLFIQVLLCRYAATERSAGLKPPADRLRQEAGS